MLDERHRHPDGPAGGPGRGEAAPFDFEVPVTEIHRIGVLFTLLEGEEVYRSERFKR